MACGDHRPREDGYVKRGHAPVGVDPKIYQPGGWWIYDCCSPKWYDEEMMRGESD